MKIFVMFAWLFFCGMSSGATLAQADLYLGWHQKCLNAKVEIIDQQIVKFEKSLTADPQDALCKVYLGSACALRAKEGRWGPTKLSYLNRAKKLMNEAVTEDPNSARVRMVRGIACYKIPKKFGYRHVCLQDFARIIPLAQTGERGAGMIGSPGEAALRVNERQVILYYAWLAYVEGKVVGADALRATCYQLDPTSKYGQLTKPTSIE